MPSFSGNLFYLVLRQRMAANLLLMENDLVITTEAKLCALIDSVVSKRLKEFGEMKEKERIVNARELCAMLKISSVSLWVWVKEKRILPLPRKHSKEKLRFRMEDVDALINSNPKHKRL
jgi:predicted DNA-binding transcriptional regulator AlpA